MSYSTFT